MFVRITGDFATASGLGKFVDGWSGPIEKHFRTKDYGEGLKGLGLVLLSQDPSLNLKRRRRLDRQKKMLYLDVLLNLDEMTSASHALRRKVLVERIKQEVFEALIEDKKVAEFDGVQFIAELSSWLEGAAP